MKFLSVLAAGSKQRLRRVLLRAALALASVMSAMVGVGFATGALFQAWRLQYGVISASIGLSAIYLVLAGVLYLCFRRVGLTPPSIQPNSVLSGGLSGEAETLRAGVQAVGASQAAALAVGVELAKQLTPVQLAMLSALSGFVAGRRL
jgi:hypothetical protein